MKRAIYSHVQDSPGGQLLWEFCCECGEERCDEHVFLTLDGYIALHDHGDAVLAEGHCVSQVGRSRQLRADAEALTGEAGHQVRRAKSLQKRLGGPGFSRRNSSTLALRRGPLLAVYGRLIGELWPDRHDYPDVRLGVRRLILRARLYRDTGSHS